MTSFALFWTLRRGDLISISKLLTRLTTTLKDVKGIRAIVLGGSRATGTHRPDSDIDIGLYYTEKLDIERLNQMAKELDDDHRDALMTQPGEWGQGVNGGGWLIVDGYHVDLLYREMGAVDKAIKDCRSGIIEIFYQTGHPHGFLNLMYMGEVHICQPLWTADEELQRWKQLTDPYPEAVRQAVLGRFGFEMSFSHMFMANEAAKEDLSYMAGHAYRAVACLNQYLFALNGQYCLNEKNAVPRIDGFSLKPLNYKQRIERIFHLLSSEFGEKKASTYELKQLIEEAVALRELL